MRDVSINDAGEAAFAMSTVFAFAADWDGADTTGTKNAVIARKTGTGSSIPFLQCRMRWWSLCAKPGHLALWVHVPGSHEKTDLALDVLDQLLESGFFELYQNPGRNPSVLAHHKSRVLELLVRNLFSDKVVVFGNIVPGFRTRFGSILGRQQIFPRVTKGLAAFCAEIFERGFLIQQSSITRDTPVQMGRNDFLAKATVGVELVYWRERGGGHRYSFIKIIDFSRLYLFWYKTLDGKLTHGRFTLQ
jgi:hypothetical protein